MQSAFRALVAYAVMVSMLLSGLVWPGKVAAAAFTLTSGGTVPVHTGGCDIGDPEVAAGRVPGCKVVVSPTGARMAHPVVQWSTVATLAKDPATGFNVEYVSGNRLDLAGLRGAKMLGIDPNQAADMVNTFPSGVPVVFARYNPGTSDLRIDLFKTERTPEGVKLMNAVFSPHHGALWAATGRYADPDTKRNGGFGVNPFERFAAPGDDVFHTIGMDGMMVAVGHAMRMLQAPIGLVAVADYRIDSWKTTKGNALKKTTTVHIEGFAKPKWLMAAPQQLQNGGASAVICAADVGEGEPCPDHYVAPSVVTFDTWEGGNLKEHEDSLYYWSKKYTGWTVLAFMLLTFVAFAVVAQVALTAGLISAPSQLSAISTLIESAAGTWASLSVPAVAAIEAGLYGLVAFASGANSLTDIQKGYGGKILGSGLKLAPVASNEHEAALMQAAKTEFTEETVEGSISAVRQTATGDCDVRLAAKNCTAHSGFLPRTDTHLEMDYVPLYRDNGISRSLGGY